MSQDEVFEIEPVRQGMSDSNKVLVGLGIGCGIVLLLCCGGLVGTGFFVTQWAEESFSDDPAVVVQTTAEITDVEIPQGFEPAVSVDMKIPFSDQRFMTMVMYGQEDEDQGMLVLAQFNEELFDEANREQMAEQVMRSIEEQGQFQENITLDEEGTEEIRRTIREQPAEFVIARGKDEESDVEFWYVTGTFEGKGGPVFIIFVAPTDKVSREEIMQLIESIR